MTEQTVQIKMENQKEAGPPDSPGQEWRLDRAAGQWGGGGEGALKGSPTPREEVLHGPSPRWRGMGQVGGDRRELRGGRDIPLTVKAGTPRRVPSENFTPTVPSEP